MNNLENTWYVGEKMLLVASLKRRFYLRQHDVLPSMIAKKTLSCKKGYYVTQKLSLSHLVCLDRLWYYTPMDKQKYYATLWHRLFSTFLQVALTPLGIAVLSEVEISGMPPKIDVVLTRKKGEKAT